MLKHDLARLNNILQKVLLIIEGGLFIAYQDEAPAVRRSIEHSSTLAQAENDWNRYTIDYTLGNNGWARWQNNLSLMLLVESHIKRLLQELSYDKETRLFITNELAGIDCDRQIEAIEIIPKLRLWTRENDKDDYLYHVLGGDRSGPGIITVRGEREQLFVSADAVYTSKGEIKKSFMRQLRGLTGWEPQRVYLR